MRERRGEEEWGCGRGRESEEEDPLLLSEWEGERERGQEEGRRG